MPNVRTVLDSRSLMIRLSGLGFPHLDFTSRMDLILVRCSFKTVITRCVPVARLSLLARHPARDPFRF